MLTSLKDGIQVGDPRTEKLTFEFLRLRWISALESNNNFQVLQSMTIKGYMSILELCLVNIFKIGVLLVC